MVDEAKVRDRPRREKVVLVESGGRRRWWWWRGGGLGEEDGETTGWNERRKDWKGKEKKDGLGGIYSVIQA